MQSDTRIQHSPSAAFSMVADEGILIHLQSGVYYSLNDVGTAFWNLMDGQRTIGQCAEAIAAEYNAPPEQILSDLIELASELAAEDLAIS